MANIGAGLAGLAQGIGQGFKDYQEMATAIRRGKLEEQQMGLKRDELSIRKQEAESEQAIHAETLKKMRLENQQAQKQAEIDNTPADLNPYFDKLGVIPEFRKSALDYMELRGIKGGIGTSKQVLEGINEFIKTPQWKMGVEGQVKFLNDAFRQASEEYQTLNEKKDPEKIDKLNKAFEKMNSIKQLLTGWGGVSEKTEMFVENRKRLAEHFNALVSDNVPANKGVQPGVENIKAGEYLTEEELRKPFSNEPESKEVIQKNSIQEYMKNNPVVLEGLRGAKERGDVNTYNEIYKEAVKGSLKSIGNKLPTKASLGERAATGDETAKKALEMIKTEKPLPSMGNAVELAINRKFKDPEYLINPEKHKKALAWLDTDEGNKYVQDAASDVAPPSFTFLSTPEGYIPGITRGKNAGTVKESTGVLRPIPAESAKQLGELGGLKENIGIVKKLYGIGSEKEKGEWVGPISGRVGGIQEKYTGGATDDQVQFYAYVRDMKDALLRARSGAQINEQEYKRLVSFLPDENLPPKTFKARLSRFEDSVDTIMREKKKALREGGYGNGEGKGIQPSAESKKVWRMKNGKWVQE